MAKAKEITGLDCEANVLDWADKILRVRFGEILEKRETALHSESIEGVHDMRVATRRLRSALRDFSPLLKKKPLNKLKKDLKQIADALGAARDQDVAIIALEKLRKKSRVENIKNGIAELIEQRCALREQANIGLLEMLSATTLKDLQKRFDRTVDEAVKHQKTAVSFNEAGRDVIGKSLKEFCALSDHIYEPFIDESLHELRIAAKRLRYAIELYTACWGKQIEPFAEKAAEMQNFLGEVHDADAWLESLSESLRNGDDNRANIWLLSEFVEKRTKNYRAALKLWSDWKNTDFIGRLQAIIGQTNVGG
ncbi:MAG: CHAD domain-containing protein [Acidobacteriota bacterium]